LFSDSKERRSLKYFLLLALVLAGCSRHDTFINYGFSIVDQNNNPVKFAKAEFLDEKKRVFYSIRAEASQCSNDRYSLNLLTEKNYAGGEVIFLSSSPVGPKIAEGGCFKYQYSKLDKFSSRLKNSKQVYISAPGCKKKLVNINPTTSIYKGRGSDMWMRVFSADIYTWTGKIVLNCGLRLTMDELNQVLDEINEMPRNHSDNKVNSLVLLKAFSKDLILSSGRLNELYDSLFYMITSRTPYWRLKEIEDILLKLGGEKLVIDKYKEYTTTRTTVNFSGTNATLPEIVTHTHIVNRLSRYRAADTYLREGLQEIKKLSTGGDYKGIELILKGLSDVLSLSFKRKLGRHTRETKNHINEPAYKHMLAFIDNELAPFISKELKFLEKYSGQDKVGICLALKKLSSNLREMALASKTELVLDNLDVCV